MIGTFLPLVLLSFTAMVSSCVAYGCTNRSKSGSGQSFFSWNRPNTARLCADRWCNGYSRRDIVWSKERDICWASRLWWCLACRRRHTSHRSPSIFFVWCLWPLETPNSLLLADEELCRSSGTSYTGLCAFTTGVSVECYCSCVWWNLCQSKHSEDSWLPS